MNPQKVWHAGVKWTPEARRAWKESERRRAVSAEAMRVAVRQEDAKRRGFASMAAIAGDLGISVARLRRWYNVYGKDELPIHWMEFTGAIKLYRAVEIKRFYRAWERKRDVASSVRCAREWVSTAEAARLLGYSSPAAARFMLHRRFVQSRKGLAGTRGVEALYWRRSEVEALSCKRREIMEDAVPAGYVPVSDLLKTLCSSRASYNRWIRAGLLDGVLLLRRENGVAQNRLYVRLSDALKVAGMKLRKLVSGLTELQDFLRRYEQLKAAQVAPKKAFKKPRGRKGERTDG